LHRERSSDDYRASLEAVHRNAEQMTRTVDALISVARREAGLSRATSDAREALRNATTSVQDEAEAAGIDIRVSVPAEPVTVAIEPELVERIVQPLLENAVRYGKRTVSVGLVRNGKMATIEVVDDGTGVSTEERNRIFEPGSRGAAAAAAPGGVGLGLALAQRLAHSVGGEIAAEPGESGGRFTVSLPLA